MSGLFGGGRPAPTQAEKDAQAAQARAEERATSQERAEMQGAQSRRRLRRTGGMRLLFSPARREGPGDLPRSTKLGGGV
jgi:GAF domain-containing protein